MIKIELNSEIVDRGLFTVQSLVRVLIKPSNFQLPMHFAFALLLNIVEYYHCSKLIVTKFKSEHKWTALVPGPRLAFLSMKSYD